MVGAQTALALLLAMIGIHASKLLHDAVPSTVRPASLQRRDLVLDALPARIPLLRMVRPGPRCDAAAWSLTAAAPLVGLFLVPRRSAGPAVTGPGREAGVRDSPARTWWTLSPTTSTGSCTPVPRDKFQGHLAGCDGCTDYVGQIRETIAALGGLGAPSPDPSRTTHGSATERTVRPGNTVPPSM